MVNSVFGPRQSLSRSCARNHCTSLHQFLPKMKITPGKGKLESAHQLMPKDTYLTAMFLACKSTGYKNGLKEGGQGTKKNLPVDHQDCTQRRAWYEP